MGNIGDMDEKFPLASGGVLEADGIIEIFGVIRIDGDDEMAAAIFPSGQLFGAHLVADGAGLFESLFGKMERQIVLAEDGKHVHAFFVRRTEDFDDFSFGIVVALFPGVEFDDDFVAEVGLASNIARLRHVDVVGDAWIIRNDVEEPGAALEGANDLGAIAFEDAENGSSRLGGGAGCGSTDRNIAADEDAIFVKGGAGGSGGNGDFGKRGILRTEETFALAIHANPAGNEIGLAGNDVAIAFDAGDLAGLLEFAEGPLQFLLAIAREGKEVEQFGDVRREIVFLSEEPEQLIFHWVDNGGKGRRTAMARIEGKGARAGVSGYQAKGFESFVALGGSRAGAQPRQMGPPALLNRGGRFEIGRGGGFGLCFASGWLEGAGKFCMKTRVSTLENGMTVATAEVPHMASVSLGIWVGVGGRFEPAEVCGVSHFIEHMLFKGTHRRNAREISQDVEGVGGYLNAFTTEENTCFYAKAGHERLKQLWDVLADMFLNSNFDVVEIEKERNVIREELAMYLDQPHHHVQELLNETLWPDHPLGRALTGSEETLAKLRREEMIQYKRENYVARNTLVTLAGNVEHRNAVALVSKFARRFPKANRRSFQPVTAGQNSPRIRVVVKKVEQTQLALGIRTCSRHDDRRFALRMLNVILGENMSSRLFQVLREDNGLAYSICSSLGFFDDVGSLTVSAGVETDKLEKSLKLIVGELALLAEQLPSRAELRRARDYIFGQLDLNLENTENQMTWLGEQYLGYGKIISPEELKNRIAEVTPSDVRAAARDFFRPERFNLALVSPLKEGNRLMPILSKVCV